MARKRLADTPAANAAPVRQNQMLSQAERELAASEQRFQLLVESVSDYAIYMLDPDGIVTN